MVNGRCHLVLKWGLIIGIASVSVLSLLLCMILPLRNMEELRLIQHEAMHEVWSHQSESLMSLHHENYMLDTLLDFPLSRNALDGFIQHNFADTKIVHVSIYETAPQQTWYNTWELNKTFVLLELRQGGSPYSFYATIESDGQVISYQDGFQCNSIEIFLTHLGRTARNNTKLQLIVEDTADFTSIFELLTYIDSVYNQTQQGTRACSHSRDFSKMIFNRLSNNIELEGQCGYLERIQSSLDNIVTSVVKFIGLRKGGLWAERIRYYLYQHESALYIDYLNLLLGPPFRAVDGEIQYIYNSSLPSQFYLDRRLLDFLNEKKIREHKIKEDSVSKAQPGFEILEIYRYQEPVFTGLYIPILSDYLLYHSFVVLGISHIIETKFLKLAVEVDEQTLDVRVICDQIRRVLGVGPACQRTRWLSIEKNGLEITIQSGLKREDVTLNFKGERRIKTKFWDEYYPQLMESYTGLRGNTTFDKILQSIWETDELRKTYHFFFHNCQTFAKSIYEKLLELKKNFSPDLEAMWNKTVMMDQRYESSSIYHFVSQPPVRLVIRLTAALLYYAILFSIITKFYKYSVIIVSTVTRRYRLISSQRESFYSWVIWLARSIITVLLLLLLKERLRESFIPYWKYEKFLHSSMDQHIASLSPELQSCISELYGKKVVRIIDGVAREVIDKHNAYGIRVEINGVPRIVECPVTRQDFVLED